MVPLVVAFGSKEQVAICQVNKIATEARAMKNRLQLSRLGQLPLLLLATLPLFLFGLASAQIPAPPQSCQGATIDPALLGEDAQPVQQGVITANTISEERNYSS